ncbi:hypothetical protein VTO73DRAFT_12547 [Trametes versicolor]
MEGHGSRRTRAVHVFHALASPGSGAARNMVILSKYCRASLFMSARGASSEFRPGAVVGNRLDEERPAKNIA